MLWPVLQSWLGLEGRTDREQILRPRRCPAQPCRPARPAHLSFGQRETQSMHKLKGQCHCGNVRVEIELVRSPETYNPRACDCDFCSKHAAAYVSDPQGSLLMQVRDDAGISRYRQGSGAAECI